MHRISLYQGGWWGIPWVQEKSGVSENTRVSEKNGVSENTRKPK